MKIRKEPETTLSIDQDIASQIFITEIKKAEGLQHRFYSDTSLFDLPNIEGYFGEYPYFDIIEAVTPSFIGSNNNEKKYYDFLEIAIKYFQDIGINPKNVFDIQTNNLAEYRYEVAKAFYEIGLVHIAMQIIHNELRDECKVTSTTIFDTKNKEFAMVISRASEQNLTNLARKQGYLRKLLSDYVYVIKKVFFSKKAKF